MKKYLSNIRPTIQWAFLINSCKFSLLLIVFFINSNSFANFKVDKEKDESKISITIDVDTDGDGIMDLIDIDDDNDGILDIYELNTYLYYNSFEEDDWSNYDSTPCYQPGTSTLNGKLVSVGGINNGKSLFYNTDYCNGTVHGPSGNVGDYNIGDEFWGTKTPLNVVPNSNYTFSFHAWGSDAKIEVFINGVKIGGPYSVGSDPLTATSYTWNSGSATTMDISMRNLTTEPFGNDYYIDELIVTGTLPQIINDADLDGVINSLDLDSDNDGCSDAFEARLTSTLTPNFAFTGPFGANGFDNSLETFTDSGIAKVVKGFEATQNTGLKLCADNDNDGIIDLIDSDDDNDGILDVTECPDCFYTEAKASVPLYVSSELNYGTRDITKTYDDINENSFFFNTQDILNKTIFEIVPRVNMVAGEMVFYCSPTFLPTTPNAIVAQGWNGSSWVDLTAAITAPAVANGKITIPFTTNLGVYVRYRLFGVVSANVSSAPYIEEILITPATPFQSSVFPKPNCTTDTDGDGILNLYDLDSDGDGCSDANEGGATSNTSANYVFTGSVGNNGLDNSLETSPDNGELNYVNRYKLAATVAGLNACTDSDGDSIPNLVDTDDDNDGIMDAIETPNCFYTVAEASKVILVTTELPLNTLGESVEKTYDADLNSYSLFKQNSSLINKEIFAITPALPLSITSIDLTMFGWALTDAPTTTMVLQGFDGVNWMDLETVKNRTVADGTESFVNTLHPNVIFQKFRIFGITGTIYFGGTKNIVIVPNNFVAANYPKPNCADDADADGIPNSIDLDSDNDGILDAVENTQASTDTDGDGIPNYLDLDSDNDGIPDLIESGNASAIAADTNKDGKISDAESDSGVNGIPLAAETTEGGTVPAPKDQDGDGRPDAYDLDSDNDGINDLTESGNPATLVADTNSDGTLSLSESLVGVDGIPAAAQGGSDGGTIPATTDTDSDGVADFRDLDSDNDGINDIVEAGIDPDTNGNGLVDGSTDADNDGIIDSVDLTPAVFGDANSADSPSADVKNLNGPIITGADPDGDGIVGTADFAPNTFGDSNIPLSVELLRFSGNQVSESIVISWKTNNEKYFSHFEVERSANAKEFGSIGTVLATNQGSYNLIDSQPIEGHNFYRLRMVDIDGTSKVSKVINVRFEKGVESVTVQSPAVNGTFNVNTNIKEVHFKLMNAFGANVTIQLTENGNGSFQVTVRNPVSGTYFLTIEGKNKPQVRKVIIP